MAVHNPHTEVLGISPDTFHIFAYNGEYLLYDRSTSLVCELNEFTYDLFLAVAECTSDDLVIQRLFSKYKECNLSLCRNAIDEIKKQDFFRTRKIYSNISEISFDDYLSHHPRRIQLMMAESCNLKCGYCYAWRNNANDHRTFMSWRTAKTAVDFLVWRSAGRRNLQVTFFGGEPLLNLPVIKKTVAYCRQIEVAGHHQFLFELITNGTLLTPEVTDYIAENKFLLFISLDGWQEMHNHNRPAVDGDDLHKVIVQNAVYANTKYNQLGLPQVKVRANLTSKFRGGQKQTTNWSLRQAHHLQIGKSNETPYNSRCGLRCLS
ncbi:hypothetical protein FACS189419_09410 [Planctomycetales bacterium]|nr:hypothetical protein FACS189419_09410 [Planctomycetales bacterium]